MAAFSFKLTRNDISPALARLASTAKNPLPVFRAMGTTFKSITEGTFNSVGSSYRPTPWPAKRDGTPSNLQKSTTLAKSFHLEVTNSYARLKNPMIYAAIHQFGGVIRETRLPDPVRFRVGGNWVTVAPVKIPEIPARPFYPVIDGKLTPAAETKIAAAGERAIARQAGEK